MKAYLFGFVLLTIECRWARGHSGVAMTDRDAAGLVWSTPAGSGLKSGPGLR